MIHRLKLIGEKGLYLTFQRVRDEVHIYAVHKDGHSIDTEDFGELFFKVSVDEFYKMAGFMK